MGKVAEKPKKQSNVPNLGDDKEIRVRVHLGANGRIVVPAEVREALGLSEGDRLLLRATPEGLELLTPRMALRSVQRRLAKHRKPGRSIVDEFIAEKRAEAERE